MRAVAYRRHHAGARPRSSSRHRGKRRSRRSVAARLFFTFSAVAAGTVVLLEHTRSSPVVSACTATPSPASVSASASASVPVSVKLTPEQAQNAAIIAGVAFKMGLPDHAVTVALATAMQESGLRDLTYGDRDSLGLFQQRPSQGWGAPSQVLDPVYAATAFYARLRQVPGWATMAVAQAAQAVQQSGSPGAYGRWEGQARTLAVALTGEDPAAFTCRLAGFAGAIPSPAALPAAAAQEMGTDVLNVPLAAKAGWEVASWVVAHAWQYHVHQVSFGQWTWSGTTGRWTDAPAAAGDPGVVRYS
jgi:hypothetical protein